MNERMNSGMNEWIVWANSAVLNHLIDFLMRFNALFHCSYPHETDGRTDGNIVETQTDRPTGWQTDQQRCDLGREIAHFLRILRDCFRLYNCLVIATYFSIATSLSQHTKLWMKYFLDEMMKKFVSKFSNGFAYEFVKNSWTNSWVNS